MKEKFDKEILPDGLIKYSGRYGEENEYVEFRYSHRRISFVAQLSGNIWHVYKVWPGKKGNVRLLNSFLQKNFAIEEAKIKAIQFA